MLTMFACVQQEPPDHRGGYDLATDEVRAEAETYDEARASIERLVPAGFDGDAEAGIKHLYALVRKHQTGATKPLG